MTVLVVHERYRQPGGEDVAVEADVALLEASGHRVVRHERSNDEIDDDTTAARIVLAGRTLWSRRAAQELDRLLDATAADVVHLHNTFPLLSPAVAVTAARRGVPVVQTVQNLRLVCAQGLCSRGGLPCHACLDGHSPLPGLRHACYRGSRGATAVVTAWQLEQRLLERVRRPVALWLPVSDYVRRRLVDQRAIPGERSMVRHNHVADPGPRCGPSSDGPAVFSGRVVLDKGIEVLLRAAALVPEVPVVVAGDGPDRPAMEALRRALRAENVCFTGRLPRAEALALVRSARCLVQPSVCEDPNPLSVLEAAATGVPCIGSHAGGIPEAVTDPGSLVPPGDVGALAAALADTAKDPARWAARGRAARALYEERFSPAAARASLLEAYRRVGVDAS